jgi:hypothetical protein
MSRGNRVTVGHVREAVARIKRHYAIVGWAFTGAGRCNCSSVAAITHDVDGRRGTAKGAASGGSARVESRHRSGGWSCRPSAAEHRAVWYAVAVAVDQHYLPQFYLRQWAGADGKVIRYVRTPTGRLHERQVGPRGAGFEPDLYATPPAVRWETYDPNIIETGFMSPIDNAAALVLRKLVSGAYELDDGERTSWAIFLNSLAHRHRDALLERDALAPDLAREVTANLLARYSNDEDRERVAEVLREADAEQMAKTAHRTLMVQAIRGPDAVGAIKSQAWTVLVMDPKTPPLITTDRPLLVNLGKGGPPSLMMMPLSPTRLFVTYAPDPTAKGDDPSVTSLFEQLACTSDLLLLNEQPCRYVFASRQLDDNCIVGNKVIRLRSAVEQALARWARDPSCVHPE